MIDVLLEAKRHFTEKQLPFVVFSKPNQDKVIGLFQKTNELYFSNDLNESGFVLAPFEENEIVLIPEDKSEIKVSNVVMENETINDIALDYKSGKEAFERLVQQGVDAIKGNQFQKVVLSRKEVVELGDLNFTDVFQRLLNSYPTAFKYCWFHPEVGMWIGATPEQLLKAEGKTISTVALAGTQKFEENEEVIWEDKEIEEQKFVTDFIVDSLKGITLNMEVSEPYTLRAGSIVHIKTDVEAVLKPEQNLKNVISILHPTPAVCGLPKDAAKDFIIEYEGYKRDYYSGFLGELNKDFATGTENTDLFVNLRCMQIKEKQAHLYIGCGITKDSIPEKEFIETVNKSLTMKRILT